MNRSRRRLVVTEADAELCLYGNRSIAVLTRSTCPHTLAVAAIAHGTAASSGCTTKVAEPSGSSHAADSSNSGSPRRPTGRCTDKAAVGRVRTNKLIGRSIVADESLRARDLPRIANLFQPSSGGSAHVAVVTKGVAVSGLNGSTADVSRTKHATRLSVTNGRSAEASEHGHGRHCNRQLHGKLSLSEDLGTPGLSL